MTGPKAARALPLAAPSPLFLRDEELTRGFELLEAAYRGLIAEPDRRLAAAGLGRNHRRILHGIGRQPEITMVELRALLGLTKQSLSRLLAGLVDQGLVIRTEDDRDRRRRPLRLSERGRALDEDLNRHLRRRLADAYRAAGADAVAGCQEVLLGLVDERTRRQLRGAD